MDDLISRKELDDAFTKLRWNEDGTMYHWGDRQNWCLHGIEIDKLIHDAPTVPAVPLDKLCEWLEVHARTPIYNMQHTAEWWKEELEMWMEEQDADRQ